MSILTEATRLIDLAERLRPKNVKSALWRRQVGRTLQSAARADLVTRYRYVDDTGACEGSPEEEIWLEGTQSGGGLSRTRIEHLMKRLADTSQSSTERTSEGKKSASNT